VGRALLDGRCRVRVWIRVWSFWGGKLAWRSWRGMGKTGLNAGVSAALRWTNLWADRCYKSMS